jgi:hypothetical protein
MAITVLASPQLITPAYNPMYIYLDSTSKTELGFRYVIEVLDASSNVIGTYRVKPIPVTLYGEIDISKLVQTLLYNDFRNDISYTPAGHLARYSMNLFEEYFVNEPFTDYEFAGSGTWANFSNLAINPNGFARTMLSHVADPELFIGAVIQIAQTPSVNFRPELEGIHTVIDTFEDAGTWYTVLDLVWIGNGSTSSGVVSFANGNKTVIPSGSITFKNAIKSAFSFVDFKGFDHTDYVLNGNTKKLLTSLPNDFRISRLVPTWSMGYFDEEQEYFAVFNIGDDIYRYSLGVLENEFSMFQILPTPDNITEIYVGAGTFAPTIFTGLGDATEYTVQIQLDDTTPVSELRTVSLYSECDFHTKYDITFLDRLGSWVTMPFYKGAYINQSVERLDFRKKYGALSDGAFTYEMTDNGKETYHVDETVSITLNTGILSEVESQYIRELISSPQMYLSIDGGEPRSISLTTTSAQLHLKRTQRDRKLSITFEYSVQDEING